MLKKSVYTFAFASLISGSIGLTQVHAESTSTSQKTKFVNENGISVSYADFDRLKSLDFSEEDIKEMDQEEFDMNQNLEGEEVAENTEYIKVIEQEQTNKVLSSTNSLERNKLTSSTKNIEKSKKYISKEQKMTKTNYLKEVEAAKRKMKKNSNRKVSGLVSDSYSTSYKKITTSAIKLSSGKLRVKNRVVWNIMPKNRDVDVIGVAIKDSFAGNKSTAYGKQSWSIYDYDERKLKKGSATYSPSKKATLWDINGDGFGVKMNLKNDDRIVLPGTGYIGKEVRDSTLTMYYNVGKVTSNINRLDAYGRYAHAVVITKPSFGFSLSTALSAGLSFSLNEVEDFDISNHTVATLKL